MWRFESSCCDFFDAVSQATEQGFEPCLENSSFSTAAYFDARSEEGGCGIEIEIIYTFYVKGIQRQGC